MKNIILITALLFSSINFLFADNNTKINISFTGLKDSTEIQLKLPYKNSHHRASLIERAYLINGKASFDIDIEESRVLHLGIYKNYGVIRFMVSQGEIVNVSADVKIKTDYGDGSVLFTYENSNITGSSVNDKYQELSDKNLAVWKKYEPKLAVYKEFTKKIYEAEDNDDTETVKQIKSTEKYKEYITLYNKIGRAHV